MTFTFNFTTFMHAWMALSLAASVVSWFACALSRD